MAGSTTTPKAASSVAYGAGTLWMREPGDSLDPNTVNGIRTAIDLGYRKIDGAQMYHTEPEIGVAVRDSRVSRSDMAVTTKTLDLDDVEASLEESLARLQMDYIDIYLIHSPFVAKSKEHLQEAWRGMERCFKRGLAKKIGVSSFTAQHMDWILQVASIKPAMNQIEMHPYLQQPALLAYLEQRGIAVQGFASLSPLNKVKDGPADKPCKVLAERYGVSEAAILLRWVIDQGAGVVTTSGKKERLAGYLSEVDKFRLTPEEVRSISEPSKNEHFRDFFAEDFEVWEKEQIE